MQLKKESKLIESMVSAMKSFPWEDREAYAGFLAQTYYYVCHSTRLLAAAASRMGREDQVFYRRFVAHMGEENGHEFMALNDLKALGYRIEDFPELPETRMFWETQYYKIEHHDPLSLMGYIYALEVLASKACPGVCEILDKTHGKKSHTFIRVHGEEDPEHVARAREQIMALGEERLKWVQENFEQTVAAYQHFLRAIVDEAHTHKNKAA